MSYETYRIIHFLGIFLVITALGSMTGYVLGGGAKAEFKSRKFLAAMHGTGMLIALFGGFGLLAKLQIPWPWPLWLHAKLIIWIVLGALPTLIYRNPQQARLFWGCIIFFTLAAAVAAGLKPS